LKQYLCSPFEKGGWIIGWSSRECGSWCNQKGKQNLVFGPKAKPKLNGCSSIGRVAVSKTVGWEFESLHPCFFGKDLILGKYEIVPTGREENREGLPKRL
jgi:hypothetical protein